MTPVLIIGYGNSLRGDDAAGRLAAEALESRWPERLVRVIPAHQLLVEHAADLAACSRVIFVDAARDGEPGALNEREVRAAAVGERMTHAPSPEGLLAAARELYGRAPEAFLFTVAGADFGPGERLSPAVAAALPELVARVAACTELRLAARGGAHA